MSLLVSLLSLALAQSTFSVDAHTTARSVEVAFNCEIEGASDGNTIWLRLLLPNDHMGDDPENHLIIQSNSGEPTESNIELASLSFMQLPAGPNSGPNAHLFVVSGSNEQVARLNLFFEMVFLDSRNERANTIEFRRISSLLTFTGDEDVTRLDCVHTEYPA